MKIPIIGVGGIQCLDDVMEFIVAGASAVQIGTANFYNPGLSNELVKQLHAVVQQEKVSGIADLVGSLQIPKRD